MSRRESSFLSSLVKKVKKSGLDPLSPLIDEYLIRRERSEERLPTYKIPIVPAPRLPGRLSPSQLAGCLRQAAFNFLGVKGRKKINPDSAAIFDDGIWRHHRWQATFLDMEKVLGSDRFRVLSIEEPVEIPELYVAGTLDVSAWIEDFGKVVIDIKGANEFAWSYIVDTGEPREEHPKQLRAYMRAKKIRRGMLMYESKNSQLRKICLVEWDRAVWAEVAGWCKDVTEYLETKTLPPMHEDCSLGTFLFERCPYTYLCYGEKSPKVIREYVYQDFMGVEETWKRYRKPRKAVV